MDKPFSDSSDERPEWAKNFNPWEFGSMLPASEFSGEWYMGDWHELRRHFFLFLDLVLPPDYNELSSVEEPSADIERRCDEWIRMFVSSTDRKHIIVPPDLRKWLAIRTRRALVRSEYEAFNKDKFKEPDTRGNFNQEIMSWLIDRWHESGKAGWLADPTEAATDEHSSMTWFLQKKGVKLKPATTWPEVMKLADTMLKVVDLKGRYPVGQVCSDMHNDLCELWLREAIFAADRSPFKAEPDVAPWLAARLYTAKTLMKSYVRGGSKAPFPEGNAEQALYALVVPHWKKSLWGIWLGFHYKKGKLTWDGSRCPGQGNPADN